MVHASQYWKLMKIICTNSKKVHQPYYTEGISMGSKGGSRVAYLQHNSLSALLKSVFPLFWLATKLFRPIYLSVYIYQEGIRKWKDVHFPPSPQESFCLFCHIHILGSTALHAAYLRHRAMGQHQHIVTDNKPSINTSKAHQLDQADALSAQVNQTPVEASRDHRGLHSTWSWLLRFTLRWGHSWSKGFVWFQEAEPLQKSVWCNQDAVYCNPPFFETQKGVTFSWDQERALLIFWVCETAMQFWASPALSPVQMLTVCRNDNSVWYENTWH